MSEGGDFRRLVRNLRKAKDQAVRIERALRQAEDIRTRIEDGTEESDRLALQAKYVYGENRIHGFEQARIKARLHIIGMILGSEAGKDDQHPAQ